MSRIEAAARALVRFYWSRIQTDIFTRPIYSQSTNEIVGYFDRISVKEGETKLDGWVKSKSLTVETDTGFAVVQPNLERPDVPGGAASPGFSISLPGSRSLEYSVDSDQPFSRVEVGGRLSKVKNITSCMLLLAPFAFQNRKDIWEYLIRKDPLAGDRLEFKLLANSTTPTHPIATSNLFGSFPVPSVKNAIDIIVPVYNAFEETRRCLKQLADHTNSRHRVLLIDDASSDPRILSLLQEWALQRDNTQLLINTENQGFVKSVNNALLQSKGHVVLLNTDAFVGENWLDRLMAPMQSDDQVASVTPLSNTAEILSIPFFKESHNLSPEQASMIDSTLSNLNWQTAICDVPTGVGFCMLMNRRWLNLIPQFDEAFGTGYGEEVDWCRKTVRLGAKHVGHGGLFVEHIGASSFSKSSSRLKAMNQKILSSRYPGFDMMVQNFNQTDPLIGPRLAAALTLVDDGKQIPVYLAHDSGGGANLWLGKEIKTRADNGRPAIVVRGRPVAGAIKLEIHFEGREVSGLIPREDLPKYLNIPRKIHLIYSCLALTSKPLEIINNCLDKLRISDGVSVLFHDFFPLCPSHNLIDSKGKYCDFPSAETCNGCYATMAKTNVELPATIQEWRSEWLELLNRADQIVTFSDSTRKLLLRVWPQMQPKTTVKAHSMDWLPPQINPPRFGNRVVGVLGAIGYQKGAAVLRDLARSSRYEFDIVVIGQFDPSYKTDGIKVHGDYERRDIEALAKRYGIMCWLVPSIWPETFCYAAHEALATGLPVFAFDLGAQGQAIAAAKNGQTLPLGCSLDRVKLAISKVAPTQPPHLVQQDFFPKIELQLHH